MSYSQLCVCIAQNFKGDERYVISQSISQLINQSVSQLINQSVSQLINQSFSQLIDQSVNVSVS